MISLDKRVITSVNMDVDLEGCDENQAFEKMVDIRYFRSDKTGIPGRCYLFAIGSESNAV